jgi:hypothetical protein
MAEQAAVIDRPVEEPVMPEAVALEPEQDAVVGGRAFELRPVRGGFGIRVPELSPDGRVRTVGLETGHIAVMSGVELNPPYRHPGRTAVQAVAKLR